VPSPRDEEAVVGQAAPSPQSQSQPRERRNSEATEASAEATEAPEATDAAESAAPLPSSRLAVHRPASKKVKASKPPPANVEKGLASLEISSTPATWVRVNGKEVGRSPATVGGLAAGEVVVELREPSLGIAQRQSFSLEAGERARRQISIGSAMLEFRIRPFATITLDGKLLGQTPFPPLQVYEGKHSIRLVNEGLGKDVQMDYDVHAGRTNVLKLNLGE
jgi:serine/threonine-protein kinase